MGEPKTRQRVSYTTNGRQTIELGKMYARSPAPNQPWFVTGTTTFTPTFPYSELKVTKDQTNPGPPYTSGGPFTSVKSSLWPSPVMGHGVYDSAGTFNTGTGPFFRRYVGGFGNPNFDGIDFTTAEYLNPTFLNGGSIVLPVDPWYPKVDDALRPRLSKADGAIFLIEMKDAPRMLQKTAGDFKRLFLSLTGNKKIDLLNPRMPKEVADSFLNHQFGWAPFISDLQKLLTAFEQSDAFIQDITGRNGRWDHRSRVLQEDEVDGESSLLKGDGMKVVPSASPLFLSLVDTSTAGFVSFEYLIQDVVRVWCSGDYKFYRPEFDQAKENFAGIATRIKRQLVLYGLEINPYVLWKVTPWSWLIDWFFNVGPFIQSFVAASSDQVVSKNLYLMHRRRRRIVLRQNIRFFSGLRSFDFPREIVVKRRAVAETPFGFGPTWSSLTPRQWAILGALGASRRKPLSGSA